MAYIEAKARNFREVDAAERTLIINTDHVLTIEKTKRGSLHIRMIDGLTFEVLGSYAERFLYCLFKSDGPIYMAYENEESDHASS